jgi:putative DNA primase/helicase
MNINENEIFEQIRHDALSHGVVLPERLIPDGVLRRFKINGRLDGAYKLHIDGGVPAGFYQDFKQGIKQNWKFKGEIKSYTSDEKRAFSIKKAEAERKLQAEEFAKHQNAANEASKIWALSKPAAFNFPYLVKKQIRAHEARVYNNALLLPLFNEQLRMMSLQFIGADGVKRYLKGGQKQACFWWIGEPTQTLLIAEGFATAATLHEQTGYQVFIAYDAGNLLSVAKTIRARKPIAKIIICADLDENGRGEDAANEAALAIDGLVIVSPYPTDFNDWVVKAGGVIHA